MAINQMRRSGETMTPQVVEIYGSFSPNGASAPTVFGGTNTQPTGPYNDGTISVVRTSTGLFTVTLRSMGQRLISAAAWMSKQAIASGAASAQVLTYPAIASGVITFTIQLSVQTNITGQGVSTAVDVTAGNGDVFWNLVFSDADYGA